MKYAYLHLFTGILCILIAGASCSKEEEPPMPVEEETVYLSDATYYGERYYGEGTSEFYVVFESEDYAEVEDDRDGDGESEFYITKGYLLYVDIIDNGGKSVPSDGKYRFSYDCEPGTFGGIEVYKVDGDDTEYERTLTYRSDRDYYYNACGGAITISNGGRRWQMEIKFDGGETRRYSFQGTISYSDDSVVEE